MPRYSITLSQGRCAVHGGRSSIGIDSYFKDLSPLVFPEFELFTSVTTIGSNYTIEYSGFAAKQIKITLPNSITTLMQKVFTSSEFYAQDRLVIPASNISSESGFSNITTLTDIIFTAKTFTNIKGWSLLSNCTANLVFLNATAAPPAAGTMGTFKGYVYVPDALVDAWKAVSGWSALASRILPLSQWVTT